jgi:hypothetical protein
MTSIRDVPKAYRVARAMQAVVGNLGKVELLSENRTACERLEGRSWKRGNLALR